MEEGLKVPGITKDFETLIWENGELVPVSKTNKGALHLDDKKPPPVDWGDGEEEYDEETKDRLDELSNLVRNDNASEEEKDEYKARLATININNMLRNRK